MSESEEWTVDDRLQALKETREKLAVIEREWKYWREQSRSITTELVVIDKFSVAKASQLSGHHRNTISVWMQVHNALQKELKKAKE